MCKVVNGPKVPEREAPDTGPSTPQTCLEGKCVFTTEEVGMAPP